MNYDRCILTPNGHEIVGLVNAAIAMLEDMKQEVRASAGDVTVLFPTPAPSKVEDDGRVAEYSIDDALRDLRPPSDPVAQVRALSLALGGVAVLLKGQQDLLTAGERVFVVSDLDGTSPRRCGGQGDILAGTLGTALYWAVANLQPERVVGIERRIKSSIAVSMQRNQTGAAGGAGGSSSPSELCPDLEHVPELLRKPVLAGAVLASTVTRKAAWNAFSVHRRATTTTEILGSIGRAFEAVSPEELH
jgi:NAD(P)H-hydrate repair Nnr-like enzyme with NAD(P)H-hydrate dehydratase domain